MRDDFAVFILTHGRPNKVKTLKALRAGGYTGRYYLIIDNEDGTADQYRKKYGDRVIMFDKLDAAKRVDTIDNFEKRNVVVFARNECWRIAERLGVRYFLVLDDDYTSFMYRKIKGSRFAHVDCKQLDRLFGAMLDFLDVSDAITVAFAQGGDFIGGVQSGTYHRKVLRKAMNTFFCRTDRRFDFVGRINEDVCAYVLENMRGQLLLTITDVMITQTQTQANQKGLTDVYLELGTYVKSFYSVICAPSCVKVSMMGDKHKRIHHSVAWDHCAPKILNERYRKAGGGNGNR